MLFDIPEGIVVGNYGKRLDMLIKPYGFEVSAGQLISRIPDLERFSGNISKRSFQILARKSSQPILKKISSPAGELAITRWQRQV